MLQWTSLRGRPGLCHSLSTAGPMVGSVSCGGESPQLCRGNNRLAMDWQILGHSVSLQGCSWGFAQHWAFSARICHSSRAQGLERPGLSQGPPKHGRTQVVGRVWQPQEA